MFVCWTTSSRQVPLVGNLACPGGASLTRRALLLSIAGLGGPRAGIDRPRQGPSRVADGAQQPARHQTDEGRSETRERRTGGLRRDLRRRRDARVGAQKPSLGKFLVAPALQLSPPCGRKSGLDQQPVGKSQVFVQV